MKHNILIIGSGGREHALGWKLKQSGKVGKIYFAPGNGGTSQLGENVDIKASDVHQLLQFAISHKIDLTVVGPEDTLALGIVDLFQRNNLMVFGPSQRASRLESSKSWSSVFMKKYGIPHPVFYRFDDYAKACAFFNKHSAQDYVIKVSGLVLGKGVTLPQSQKEALETLKNIMVKKIFGEARKEIVIQEKLYGQELSLIAFCDGDSIIPLLTSQDHKRIFDNDKGPNTGGVGAYAPVSFVTEKLMKEIQKTILQPTIYGMKRENSPFKGALYAGLMITEDGPKVLEFNVRFGDPETQPQMMLFKSDMFPVLMACIKGKLNKEKLVFHKGSSVCVVLSSKGYPGTYEKGEIIYGLEKKYERDIYVFHAGTMLKNNRVITSGGRVLGITGQGKDMKSAIKKAYSIIGKQGVYFKGMQYRKDIGKKAQMLKLKSQIQN